VHTLVGGGGQHGGYDALDYRRIKHGDAGKLGNCPILFYLPDKFARFLYEFHAFRFESLDLLPLPADRSDFDVHGALKDEQVRVERLLQYLLAIVVCNRLYLLCHVSPIHIIYIIAINSVIVYYTV
jgi:hypothetical protein